VSTSSSKNSDKSNPAIKDTNGVATESARISRREFGLDAAVAAAGALSLSLPPAGYVAERRDRGNLSPTLAAGEQETAAPKLTPEQSQEVEAKLANIVRKYGERLSEEQRKHLRRILAYNETMLESVREFTLQNGDPPVTVLKLSSGKNNQS
jgi:hypothetical protein